jgi:hypothetical protein
MIRLAAIAVERGWERIDFQVLDWNPARGFYRRLGIEHLGDWLRYGGDAAALRRLAAEDLPPRICRRGFAAEDLPPRICRRGFARPGLTPTRYLIPLIA